MERIPYPKMAGDYITVYHPQKDVYRGEDSLCFQKNTEYESWTVNDFSILNDGGTWHLLGITHPTPSTFLDDYTFRSSDVHDAEHMLFHATAQGKTMADILRDGAFTDEEKLLYPCDRPDEMPECHAPHVLRDKEGAYHIVYGPRVMRMASTRDFSAFSRRNLFEDHPTARDPFVYEEDGTFYFVYAVENRIDYRTTRDFVHFSEPRVLQMNPWSNEAGEYAASESPVLFRRKGFYYLAWSVWDGRAGCYDHRTLFFGARTLEGLAKTAPLAMLPAHAGEFYSDESGEYLLSVFYPNNGINVAPIVWENDETPETR